MKSIKFCTSQAVLVLILLLSVFTMTPVVKAQGTYSLTVAVSGSSFIWSMLKKEFDTAVTTAFQSDLGNAGGAGVTITVQQTLVNATALFIEYTAVSTSASADEVSKMVFSNPLTNVNQVCNMARTSGTLSGYADLIPKDVKPFTPLFPPPNGGGNVKPANVTTLTADQVILLSGDFGQWQNILENKRAELTHAVKQSIITSVAHADVTADCDVKEYDVVQADADMKSIGNGQSGLMITVLVMQNKTAKTLHVYDSLELSSLLMSMNVKDINTIYNGATAKAGGKGTVITVVAVRDYTSDEWKCNALCKGMIGMGVVIGALVIISYIITICAVCCPCGVLQKYTRRFNVDIYSDREPMDDDYKYEERSRRDRQRYERRRPNSQRRKNYHDDDYDYDGYEDERGEYSRDPRPRRYRGSRRPY